MNTPTCIHQTHKQCFSASLFVCILLFGTCFPIGNTHGSPSGTMVQVVNATSVPTISLKVDGKLLYPEFDQGLQSGEFTVDKHKLSYTVSDTVTNRQISHEIVYEQNTYQSLVITGDFRPISRLKQGGKKVLEPYLEFNVLSHLLKPGEKPLRYRFLNGFSSTSLTIEEEGQEWILKPGQIVSFYDQPAVKLFKVKAAEDSIETLIRQDGNPRNCTIVFYEQKGSPTFMRIFENAPKGLK
ncbi:MAG: hypothetical protein AAF571_13490 [Verrucomicrobiota bacterium]